MIYFDKKKFNLRQKNNIWFCPYANLWLKVNVHG